MDYITVFCTVPNRETAEKIALAVVQSRKAACVSIMPGLTSVYHWKGELCRTAELLLIMKTRRQLFDALESEIKALHPYEVPEIVALTIEEGHAPYLSWIGDSTIL